jgi:phosphoribosyl-AMP cyclohydrolase
MQNDYFQAIEPLSSGHTLPLHEVVEKLAFNDQRLIPVITQDATSKAVLMMAWMNQSALEQTLSTGRMTYWSRSRNAFWVKGDTSGNTQDLINMSIDCDGDAILCQVNQKGAACHTGRPGCFYLQVDAENQQIRVHGDIA